MKFLVDQNLPARLADRLSNAGYDAVHTTTLGLEKATDPEVFYVCRAEQRILVTADKKLTKFLAATRAAGPSVLVLRDFGRSADPAEVVLANLENVEKVLSVRGAAVFSFAPEKPIRVELLPLGIE